MTTGERIGAYRLLSELGTGGMGKVYLAEVDPEAPAAVSGAELTPGTRVALKVVHPHLLASPDFFQRFLREAEIGKAVSHPNVVRTYLVDSLEREGNELHYMVMEYVEGQTLRSLLGELGRVPEQLCRHIGREVTKGLSAIHGSGVVHRDLKPENVLITRDEVVKVMDLGVAFLQDQAIRLSQTGMFVGSVQYAAPEQFEGTGAVLDGRADLYALGVVLYELATSEHPFGDVSFRVLVSRVLKEKPRRIGELNPQLSPFFEEVVHNLLEKERDKRFESAGVLLKALEDAESSTWWGERERFIRLETKKPLRRIRIPRDTALYGRDGDLARLRDLFDHAKGGEGQVLLLDGEAGIGKTRLVDELVGQLEQAGEDVNFLFGSYPPGGAATAAGAFSAAYREHLGDDGLEETLGSYLEVTPLLIPAFAALLRGDALAAGAEPLTKDSLQTVFVHTTRALAAERPTIILIDDLHFAPEEGRALFAALALAAPGHRVLLIGTMRPGMSEEWVANLERLDHTSRIALKRLGGEDLGQLLADAFRSESLALDLADDIATKSDGNPFFIFEIIRGLREGNFIAREEDGTWVRTQIIQEIVIPSSVSELVQARISGLEEEDRDLLEVACCLGYEFDPTLVADVLGLGVVPVLKRCGRIEKRDRLIRSAGRRYVFDHHQVQEVLYAGLFAQLREQYHAGLAEALETREKAAAKDPQVLEGALAVSLCEHFLKGQAGERALRYLDPALDHLEHSYLNGAAIALADAALEVEGLLAGPARMNVLVRKAHRLDFLGRREETGSALAEALALAETSEDAAVRSRVRRARGWYLIQVGRYEEACTVLEEAIALAQGAGSPAEEGPATGNLGVALRTLGRHEEARAKHERNLELARQIGDRRGEAIANGNLGLALLDLARHEEALACFEQHLEISREIGFRQGEAIATGNMGTLFGSTRRYEKARDCFERGIALSRQIGFRQGEAIANGNLGNVFAELGRYAEARTHLERFLVLSREIGFRRGEAIALLDLGPAHAVLGDVEGAHRALVDSQRIAADLGVRHMVAAAIHGLGAIAEQRGEVAEAEGRYREALAIRREIGDRSGTAISLVALGGLLAGSGRSEEARGLIAEALALATETGDPNEKARAAIRLALLPGGDPAAALAIFTAEEARMACHERMEARYLLWLATRDASHLNAAVNLLGEMRDRAPASDREAMIKNVPLHGAVLADWRSHGDAATQVSGQPP